MTEGVAGAARRRVYAVSELLSGLNALFEDRVGRLWVAGEISGLRRPRSGHVYFTLKDETGQIGAALFRSAASRLRFELEEGLEVLVHADVSIYEARGDLQLVVRQLEPRGRGALQLAFEQLRRRLEAEGLFEEARKRTPPVHPRRIGIVTSATGAAVRDVIHVSGRRAPAIPLLVSPTRVQGEGAEHEIAEALARLASQPQVDVVLLVRGGGSLEDLQAFNSEAVARAIAACPVPVVAGVGHETDVTIADWVADRRAATPSAAAALVTPDRAALRTTLARDWRRLAAAMRGTLQQSGLHLHRERQALRMLAPSARLAAQRGRLVDMDGRLRRAMALRRERGQNRLARLSDRLHSLSPLAVLGRGYALVRREADDAIVRRHDEVTRGDGITVQLAEGRLRARVEETQPAGDGPGRGAGSRSRS